MPSSPLSESRSTAPDEHKTIEEVLAAHRDELLSFPGVAGVGRGEQDGEPCLVVFVERPVDDLPALLDGYRVTVVDSGPISALS